MENKDASTLLEKYKNGSITPQELAMLESWYNHEVETNLDQQGLEENLAKLDVHFSKLLYPTLTKRYTLWPRIAAAAALVLIVGSVYLLKKGHQDEIDRHPEFVENSADIAPGKNRAVLTLANGKAIPLSNTKNGVVIDANALKYSDSTALVLAKDAQSLLRANRTGREMTVTTPMGGQYQVILPDGTHVWLNAGSILKFPAVFASTERKVELSGEAFFEVQHNAKKPFRVVSKGQIVEDLGTAFNINAYTDEPGIKTTLLSGAARVNGLTLKPNEMAIVSQNTTKITTADLEKELAWKKGDFVFRDDDFRTVMRKVARWYDVEIIYADNAPYQLKLAGWIPRSKNISSILSLMQSTGKVHFKINGRRILVEE